MQRQVGHHTVIEDIKRRLSNFRRQLPHCWHCVFGGDEGSVISMKLLPFTLTAKSTALSKKQTHTKMVLSPSHAQVNSMSCRNAGAHQPCSHASTLPRTRRFTFASGSEIFTKVDHPVLHNSNISSVRLVTCGSRTATDDGVQSTHTEVEHGLALVASAFGVLCQSHFCLTHLVEHLRIWARLFRFILCDLSAHREPRSRQEVRT